MAQYATQITKHTVQGQFNDKWGARPGRNADEAFQARQAISATLKKNEPTGLHFTPPLTTGGQIPSQQSALRKRTLSSGRTTRSSCTEVHEPLQMGREGRTFCRVSGGGVCGEAVRETIIQSRRELWRDGKWQNLWKPINFRSLWRINESAHTSRENAQGWEEGR